ncbi:MAG TPA: peptide ABC transporter substrate-binding protein [Rariglobus sp.]|jgi:oligopeptide transport system substrate-binding protein|nr:peptide ABC transporter substrate-binding protein [Rariglobus sp.]
MIKRLFGILLVCAGVIVLVAGCSKKEAASATPLKVLRFGNGAEPQDIDPQVVTGVSENKIINALFEGLVIETPSGVGVAPGVAERWDVSSDGLVYTFHLRTDARWSDGRPVTATDFVRSYERILTPALAAEYAYQLYPLVGAEAFNKGTLTDFTQVGVKAIDAQTLQLTINNRTPYLLEEMKHYAWFAVPMDVIAKFNGLARKGTDWTRPGNFVGNGPFILKEWKPNQRLVVTRSPTYWDRATVKLDEIDFMPIESGETEERMFRSGQLEKTESLPLNKIAVYKRDFPLMYREDPYYGVYFYRLNVTKPPLNDVRVRRALAIAIDRDAIVRDILRGGQKPAWNFTPPSPSFVSTARIPDNLTEARRLLSEAGYPDGKNFPHVELLYNTLEAHRTIAEAIQQMWKTRLGVDITLRNQEWKVYLDSQNTGNYQITRAGWIGDYPDPSTFVGMWMTGAGNNQTGWSNSTYDRLLRASTSAATEAERMADYQQLEQILADEVPVIPIYFYTHVYALNPYVKGWVPQIIDNRAWKWIDLIPLIAYSSFSGIQEPPTHAH